VPDPVPDPRPVGGHGIWHPTLRRRTLGLWLVWFFVNFSYYGAFTWIPSLLVEDGFTVIRSLQFTLIITLAQLPGYAVAAVLVETWGRRRTLALFLAGSALSALGYAAAGSTTTILAAGMALSFFNLGAWGALYAVTPEVYPTAVRGRGTGSAAGFGRIASILAPLSVPVLLGTGGSAVVFVVFALAFAIAASASFLLPETRGTALD
jgi:putative MFS transporter